MDGTYPSAQPAPQLAQVWLCGDETRLRPLLAKLQKTGQARTRLFPGCHEAYCALDRGERCDFWGVHTTAGDGPRMLPLGVPQQNIQLYLVGDNPLPSTWCALLTQIRNLNHRRSAKGSNHGNDTLTPIDTKV